VSMEEAAAIFGLGSVVGPLGRLGFG
jgi:hypothetical protein